MLRFLDQWRYDRILHAFSINPRYCDGGTLAEWNVVLDDLTIESTGLGLLNSPVAIARLPKNIFYTSIIGIGGAFIIGDGDGVVSASSQDLGKIIEATSGINLHHTAKSIHVAQCQIFDVIAEVHTCETNDTNVLTEVLNQIIYECHTLTSGSTIQQGFGVPWNVLDTSQLLLKAFCTSSAITADAGPSTYVYNQGYAWVTNRWQQVTFTCTGGQIVQNAWCPQSAEGALPNNSTWYVAYTCNWTGTKWMCGCRDQACTQNLWQLQGIQP